MDPTDTPDQASGNLNAHTVVYRIGAHESGHCPDRHTVWQGGRSNDNLRVTGGSESIRSQQGQRVRKLIAFDDDTFDKLKQLARDRMATFQELADEAFADLFRKHGIPVDLKDALRKSASLPKTTAGKNLPQDNAKPALSRKPRS